MRMKNVLHDCRGSALILAAWLFAIMGVIASFLLYRSELEWASVVNLERNSKARQIAEEVLQEQLALLRKDDTENDSPADPWFQENGYFQDQRKGYQVTVKIEDESGKLNLNLLGQEELEVLGLVDAERDPLLDWIDTDGDLRSEGAEADYYQSLTPAYKPRDGFLSSLREVLAIKNGPEIYRKLSPYATVFGKYNINTLTEPNLENLLLSAGFEKSRVEKFASDIVEIRKKNKGNINSFDLLISSGWIFKDELDELRPFLTLTGTINLNFIEETGLSALLKKIGYDTNLAAQIVNRRREGPFEEVGEAQTFFNNVQNPIKVEQYFTTVSTIIRYQIWLTKGKRIYYLDTVLERVPDNGENKWRTYPLSWCFLINREAPELPAPPKMDNEEDEETDDG